MAEKQLLSVREVAEVLGFGVSSVWRNVRRGTLPQPIRIGGATRWRKVDIDRIIAGGAA